MRTCIWPGCQREAIPTVDGLVRAHCLAHERRLLAGAFGPVVTTTSQGARQGADRTASPLGTVRPLPAVSTDAAAAA